LQNLRSALFFKEGDRMLHKSNSIFSIFLLFLLTMACTTSPSNTGYSGLLDRWSRLPSGAKKQDYSIKKGRSKNNIKTSLSSKDIEEIKKITHKWQWPLKNPQVTSHFGKRGGRDHEGIDFRASTGTPVFAVGSGVVVYSGNKISGYGRMVVIKHDLDLFTVYAHHSKNLVKVGQKINQGQKIALSGRSGRVTGPHLHFELRAGSIPLNPLDFFKNTQSQRLARIP